ncbi:MAG: hypothetical protein JWP68_894, partial [Modestobacter sp.]|nr:hypothetical protein [Modestobacter sp.]
LVAKVGGKAFAFIGPDAGTVGVTCGRDAAEAAEWRDRYPGAITVSAYIGRYGWNAVDWTGPVPDDGVRWSTPPMTRSSPRCPGVAGRAPSRADRARRCPPGPCG